MHFTITLDREDPSKNTIALDGEDITKQVLVDGFSVELDDAQRPIVSLRVMPDSVELAGRLYVNNPEGRRPASVERR